MEIWRAGQISTEMLLENGSFPFADKLLQELQSQNEQISQGQVPQGLSPELMAQIVAAGPGGPGDGWNSLVPK